MDAFFESLREISVILLPILGAAVLIFLMFLLKYLIDLTKKLTATVDRVQTTIDIVDTTLSELKTPVQTLGNIARGIDTVQSVTTSSALTISKFVMDNIDTIKDWILGFFKGKEIVPEETVDLMDEQDPI